MKILHCCLAAFYIDNFGYQENILPKMHKLQGHDVAIVASTETYLDNAALGYVPPRSYVTKEGIPITRLSYVGYLPHLFAKKLRIYNGVSSIIEKFEPDIIFIHDCQFISIVEIAAYAKKHPHVVIYVDGHTDFINSARNWISKNILHGIIYKWCARKIEPYTRKFYGVIPLRVEFFQRVYNIPAAKTELLVLGVDDSNVDFSKKNEIRVSKRSELHILENDFVVITGGKLDSRKNIHFLMQAIHNLQRKDIVLIVYGKPQQQMKGEIERLAKSPYIRYLGWISPEESNNYFFAADLAFFPGTHSVIWEQAVGLGMPCVFKKWEGIQHIDLNGNCMFISNGDDINEIQDAILKLNGDRALLQQMRQIAEEKGMREFSYSHIAKKAIGVN